MTQVGHCLFGASLAVATTPAGATRREWTGRVGAMVLLANVPDLPFPGWGHQRYDISHSVFVNVGLIALAWALLGNWRERLGGWPTLAVGAGAWLSHLLLDTFYGNNEGLALFWPLSPAHVSLPIPLFHTTSWNLPATAPENVRVYLTELAVYLALLVAAVAARAAWLRRRKPGNNSA